MCTDREHLGRRLMPLRSALCDHDIVLTKCNACNMVSSRVVSSSRTRTLRSDVSQRYLGSCNRATLCVGDDPGDAACFALCKSWRGIERKENSNANGQRQKERKSFHLARSSCE